MTRVSLRVAATMFLAAGFAVATGEARAQSGTGQVKPVVQNPTGDPIRGCITLMGTDRRSGFYRADLKGTEQIVYCQNTLSFGGRRGGWTLVWSNLRNTRNDLTTNLPWGQAIGGPAQLRFLDGASGVADPQTFETFLGLRWWNEIIRQDPNGPGEILYAWAADFRTTDGYDRQSACYFTLDEKQKWKLAVTTTSCESTSGDHPGLFTYHGDRPFSAVDVDNDAHATNCAATYSGAPWWYGACWDGSISGGGENSGANHPNGAYWKGSAQHWGDPVTGLGAGNGWIFVR